MMAYATLGTPYRSRPRRRALAWVSVCALILVLADARSLPVREPLFALEAHVQTAGARVLQWYESTGFFQTHGALARENVALRIALERDEAQIASTTAIVEADAALVRMVPIARAHAGIVAPLLSGESTEGTFLVGAGTQSGVRAGDVVLADDGFVLGTVVEVRDTGALCRAVFAPGASIDGLVGNVRVALSGRGSGNASANVPRSSAIAEGQVVVIPAYFGAPAGLVGHVASSSSSASLDVYVRAPRNVGEQRFVFISHL